MKMKIAINERVASSNGCACGHAAEDHAHKHESSAGGGCCSDAADRASPAHGGEHGCCGGSHAAEASHDGDDTSIARNGSHP